MWFCTYNTRYYIIGFVFVGVRYVLNTTCRVRVRILIRTEQNIDIVMKTNVFHYNMSVKFYIWNVHKNKKGLELLIRRAK